MMLLLPLLYFLYINISCQIYAQNKQCTNCKYFIPYKNNKITTLGLCKMFGDKVYGKNGEKMLYNFAQHCRDDENLCGKNATFYEGEGEGVHLKLEDGININLEPKKNASLYNTYESKIPLLDDEMKKLINDFHNFLRNNNDW